MTSPKHWLCLFLLMAVEAVAAFVCFTAGPPLAYVGGLLVIAANIQFVGALIVALKNTTDK